MQNQSLLFAGTVFMDLLESNGASTGWQKCGNADSFSIKPNFERKDQVSKMKNTFGQTIASVVIPKPFDLALTLTQPNHDLLATAFLGDAAAYSQGAGTVTNEAINANPDRYVRLANKNITAESVVVTDETGTTTYVEGTDYTINYALGMIQALSTGAITADQVLHVSYGYAASAGYIISGATQSIIKVGLLLDGKNMVTGKNGSVEVYRAILAPTEAVDFLTGDYNQLKLEGTMETPSNKNMPFHVDMSD